MGWLMFSGGGGPSRNPDRILGRRVLGFSVSSAPNQLSLDKTKTNGDMEVKYS